jgi:hypothetical protein
MLLERDHPSRVANITRNQIKRLGRVSYTRGSEIQEAPINEARDEASGLFDQGQHR